MAAALVTRPRVSATLFAGPQEENVVAPVAPGFELVKDYGWLKIIGQPLHGVDVPASEKPAH